MKVEEQVIAIDQLEERKGSVSSLSLILLVLGFVYGLLSNNPGLSIFGTLTLFFIYRLLWRRYEPPVLFFCLAFQWLQAYTRVIQANLLGASLEEFRMSEYAVSSVAYSLIGLNLLAIGIYLTMGRRTIDREKLKEETISFEPKELFILYLAVLLVSPLIQSFARGGLAQIILAFLSIKWVFYAILAYTVFLKKEGRHFLIAAFTIELVSGFTGYFSSFKEVIFVSAIIFFTTEQKINLKKVIALSPLLISFAFIFILWTGVKEEYRKFLRGDSFEQRVTVSKTEALTYLYDLFANFDNAEITNVAQRALDRLSYTDMLMYTQAYVPETKPHQNGQLWIGALQHIFMPRIIFPNKPILDDSAVANEFTGMGFSGRERGTSISLGYFAESYVDFGMPGMFLPIFLLGSLIGRIYRFFLEKESINLMYGFGIVIAVLSGFKLFERVANKHLGTIVMSFLVFNFIVIPYVIPRIEKFLERRRNQ